MDKPDPAAEPPAEPVGKTPEAPSVGPLDTEMVSLGNVNVRDGPGTDHDQVSSLSRGTTVKVTGQLEDWYRVALDGGQEGYVFKELLAESTPEGVTDFASGAAKGLQPGDTFRDCDVCPEMVVVPAGSFVMGSPDTDRDAQSDEKPRHPVTINKPFAVGVYEVTFAEWPSHACVDGGGCYGPK